MATHISKTTVIPAAGQPPKIIEEFIGRVNSQTANISIAKMTSPSGWREPGQTPEFDEYTMVLAANCKWKPVTRFTRLRPDKRSSSMPVSGCVTVPQAPKGRSMSRSVYRLFHRRPCIATRTSP